MIGKRSFVSIICSLFFVVMCAGPVQAMPNKIKIAQPTGQNVEYNINDFIEEPQLLLDLAGRVLIALTTNQKIIGITSDNDVIDIKAAIKNLQGYSEYEKKVQDGQINQAADLTTHLVASVEDGTVVMMSASSSSTGPKKNTGQYIGCGYHVLKSGSIDPCHVITSNVVVKNEDLVDDDYISNVIDTSSDINDYISQNALSLNKTINVQTQGSYSHDAWLSGDYNVDFECEVNMESSTKKNLTMIKHEEKHRTSYVALTDLSDRGIIKMRTPEFIADIQELGNLINPPNAAAEIRDSNDLSSADTVVIPPKTIITADTLSLNSLNTIEDSVILNITGDDLSIDTAAQPPSAETTGDAVMVDSANNSALPHTTADSIMVNDKAYVVTADDIVPNSQEAANGGSVYHLSAAVTDKDINAAIDQIFDKYGTHIIKGYQLGARLEMNYLFSNVSQKTSNSISAAVKASYRGFSNSASAEVKTKITNDLEQINNNSTMKFKTTGGDNMTLTCSDIGDIKSNYQRWVDSIGNKPAMYNIPDLDQNLSGIWNYTGESKDYSDQANNPYQLGPIAKRMQKRFDELARQAEIKLNGYDFSKTNLEDPNLVITDIGVYTGQTKEEALSKIPQGFEVVRINPEGHDRDELDANHNARGRYICIACKKESVVKPKKDDKGNILKDGNGNIITEPDLAVYDEAIVDIAVFEKDDKGIFKEYIEPGWESLAVNLNEGCFLADTPIYLGYSRAKNNTNALLQPISSISGYYSQNDTPPPGWRRPNRYLDLNRGSGLWIDNVTLLYKTSNMVSPVKYFVTDVYMCKGASKSDALSYYRPGYKIVWLDDGSDMLELNHGAGSKWLYLAYKLEKESDVATKDVIVCMEYRNDWPPLDSKDLHVVGNMNEGFNHTMCLIFKHKQDNNNPDDKPFRNFRGYYGSWKDTDKASGWYDISVDRLPNCNLNQGVAGSPVYLNALITDW